MAKESQTTREQFHFHVQTAGKRRLSDAKTAERQYQTISVQSVDLRDLIKMADVVVTLKIMPVSPEVDLDEIQEKAEEMISGFGGDVGKVKVEPVAFGLKSLNLFFVMDEAIGSTDDLEEQVSEIEGVNSVEVTDVRRTIG